MLGNIIEFQGFNVRKRSAARQTRHIRHCRTRPNVYYDPLANQNSDTAILKRYLEGPWRNEACLSENQLRPTCLVSLAMSGNQAIDHRPLVLAHAPHVHMY